MASAEMRDPIWQAKGAEKRAAVQRMFGSVAPTYDRLNGIMTLSFHRRWRAYAVSLLRLKPGDTALDVCCGTGDFLTPLREAVGPSGFVAGVDFCAPMLEVATHKAEGALSLGDACRLPIQTAAVQAVSVGWGIRNVPDIDAAHREICRVLKPGGRFVSIDMARARNPLMAGLSRWTFHTLTPMLGKLFGQCEAYTYLPKSTDSFWSREDLAASMRKAGFVETGWKDLCFGNICVHWGVKG